MPMIPIMIYAVTSKGISPWRRIDEQVSTSMGIFPGTRKGQQVSVTQGQKKALDFQAHLNTPTTGHTHIECN